MSEGVILAIAGLALGLVFTAVVELVRFVVQRWLERADRRADAERAAISELHARLLAFAQIELDRGLGRIEDGDAAPRLADALLLTRFAATLVPDAAVQAMVADLRPSIGGERLGRQAGAIYPVNARIGELLRGIDRPSPWWRPWERRR